VFDENGRFRRSLTRAIAVRFQPTPVARGIGQRPDLSFLDAEDIQRDERGLVKVDPTTFRTTASDVYLAGDVAYGPKLLIHANRLRQAGRAACSRRCAVSDSCHERKSRISNCPFTGENTTMSAAAQRNSRTFSGAATQQSAGGCRTWLRRASGDVEGCRCLDCGVNTILIRTSAFSAAARMSVRNYAWSWFRWIDSMGTTHATGHPGAPGRENLSEHSAIVKDETKCIRCALCAERCPVGAITMERFSVRALWQLEPAIPAEPHLSMA
jgi:NAD-dependent dihydropyrimidine dehydrogenase PreA subunit